MGDLLALAVVAHGGMQRWDEFKTLRTVLSVAGSLWSVEQQSVCSRARSSRKRLVTIPRHILPAKHSRRPGIRMRRVRTWCGRSASTRWFHKKHYANDSFDVLSIN
jgi:hypothetical protein